MHLDYRKLIKATRGIPLPSKPPTVIAWQSHTPHFLPLTICGEHWQYMNINFLNADQDSHISYDLRKLLLQHVSLYSM